MVGSARPAEKRAALQAPSFQRQSDYVFVGRQRPPPAALNAKVTREVVHTMQVIVVVRLARRGKVSIVMSNQQLIKLV
jgi:hypothetical protein